MPDHTHFVVVLGPETPERFRELFAEYVHPEDGVLFVDATGFEVQPPFVQIEAFCHTDKSTATLWVPAQYVLAAAEIPVAAAVRMGFHQ